MGIESPLDVKLLYYKIEATIEVKVDTPAFACLIQAYYTGESIPDLFSQFPAIRFIGPAKINKRDFYTVNREVVCCFDIISI